MSHDVFICHSSEDRAIANAACVRLEAAGIRCWIAPRDPIPGIPYGRQLVEAVEAARLVLLIFSAHADGSEHVLREMELASESGKIVIPFRVEDVQPTGDLKYYIRRVHWLDAMTPPMKRRLDELVDLTRRILAIPAQPGDAAAQPLAHAETEIRTAASVEGKPRRVHVPPVVLFSAVGALAFAFAVWFWSARAPANTSPSPQPAQRRTQAPGGATTTSANRAAPVEAADVVREYYRLWNRDEFPKMFSMLSLRMQREAPYSAYLKNHASVTQIEAEVTPGRTPSVVNVHIVSHDRGKNGSISESVSDGQWYLTTENGALKLDRQVPAAARSVPSSTAFVINYYRLWNLGDYRTMYGMLSTRMQHNLPYPRYVEYHSLVTQIVVAAAPTGDPKIVNVHIKSHDREKNGSTSESVNEGQWHLVVENGRLKMDEQIVHEVK